MYEANTKPQSGFVKYDAGKLLFGLIEPAFLTSIAEVLTHGAQKYAEENWKQVEPHEGLKRYKNALWRHWVRYLDGEFIDGDSGYPHIACCAVNLMFITYFENMVRSAERGTVAGVAEPANGGSPATT